MPRRTPKPTACPEFVTAAGYEFEVVAVRNIRMPDGRPAGWHVDLTAKRIFVHGDLSDTGRKRALRVAVAKIAEHFADRGQQPAA